MPKTKQAPVIVIADLGNWGLKIIIVLPNGEKIIKLIPHDVLFLSESQFEQSCKRAKYQRARIQNSATFKKLYKDGDELFAIVGQEAVEDRNSNKRVGSQKYVRGYFDVVLAGVLLQLFPEGHDNIILGVGYPPSELAQVPNLVDTLMGVHKVVNLDGKELRYVVRTLIPADEPIGSLEWYNYNNAQFNPIDINPGDRFILIDIGGSIGTIGRVLVNADGTFAPLHNTFTPINSGVNDVYEKLHGHLKDMHPDKFPQRSIPTHVLRQALSKRELTLKDGKPFSVDEAVTQSLGIVDDVESKYIANFDGGQFDKGVLLTGGSMVDLYPEFATILDHINTSPVSEVSEIIYANVRGLELIVIAALIQDNILPINYKGLFDGYKA